MAALTALAIGLAVGGTALRAVAQTKAAKEQQRVAEYQAKQAEFNAEQALEQATDVSRRGEETASAHRREVRRLIGRQVAGYGAQGIDVSLGTARELPQQAEALLQSDLDRLKRNAEREALGFKSEAANLREEAKFLRKGGQYARSAGRWNVASTILGGGADTALMAHRFYGNRKAPGTPAPGSGGYE
jgi:hypothetical protein